MGRPKGSKNKPKPGGLDKATLAIMAKLGISVEIQEKAKEEALYNGAVSQEAEAVIAYVDAPKQFTPRLCRECQSQFLTDYGSVAFCSDRCRKAHLESLGIRWDYQKSQYERWSGRIPLVIGPEALRVLQEVSQHAAMSAPSIDVLDESSPPTHQLSLS